MVSPAGLSVNGKTPIGAWIPSLDTAGNGTTTLTDLAGSNDGTLTNMDPATDWVTSDGKIALDLDGINDYVNLGNVLNTGTSLFSISFWFKVASSGNSPRLVAKRNGGGFQVYINTSGGIAFYMNSGSFAQVITNTSNFADNVWHHCIVNRVGGATLTIIVDGVEQSVVTGGDGTPGGLNGTGDFTIGAYSTGSNPATGVMDDIRMFIDDYLVVEDSTYLYNSGEGRGISLRPLNTVLPTLSIDATSFTGTVGTWDSQSNGTLTYLWELRLASDDSVVASGTSSTVSGSGTFSGEYYLWVRASNDGGYDPAEDSVGTTQTVVQAAGTYSSEVLADSPVAYWRLGETSGTTAVDETGVNDGTYVGSSTLGATGLIAGDSDTSVDFAASGSDYVQIPDSASLSPTTAITVEAWINADTFPSLYRHFIDKSGDTQSYQFVIDHTGANPLLFFRIKSGGTWYGGPFDTALVAGTTYHVAATYDGSTIRCYVDGAQEATTYAASVTINDSTSDVAIARHASSVTTYFHGRMDEVAIYDTALSAARIQAHYDAGVAGFVAPVFSGSASLETAAASAAVAATFEAPMYTGSAGLSAAPVTLESSATFGEPTYTGAASLLVSAVITSATATFDVPVYSGSSALASGAAVLESIATFESPIYSGSATLLATAATATGLAGTEVPTYSGTADISVAPVESSITAAFEAPEYLGSAELSMASPAFSGTASAATAVFLGSAALSVSPAITEAIATHVTPVYEAAGDLIAAPMTSQGSATFVAPSYTGSAELSVAAAKATAGAAFEAPSYSATASLSASGIDLAGSATFESPVFEASATLTVGAPVLTATDAEGNSIVFYYYYVLSK